MPEVLSHEHHHLPHPPRRDQRLGDPQGLDDVVQVGHRRRLTPPQAGGEIGELVPQGPEHPSTGFGPEGEVGMLMALGGAAITQPSMA